MLAILSIMCSVFAITAVYAAPEFGRKSWPTMKNFEIWNDVAMGPMNIEYSNFNELKKRHNAWSPAIEGRKKVLKYKRSKVFNLFPVPVDGECLSNDGRRTGTCFNAYECRSKGGIAKGECAMGFGVCCIFLASCDEVISNNITYLVSPNFPSSMPNNFRTCTVKVKMMDSSISQLRIDFNHFSLGQPNRKTGICDGDVFNVSGGLSGSFLLCGQNSGQHIYYDVGRNNERQISRVKIRQPLFNKNLTVSNNSPNYDDPIEITMNFTNRFLPIRFWEIRIAQIPFSQRAPAGCLQYFTDPDGIVQTFNFADNGRHLANQHYRSCIRQEVNMCSILYQPCDDQSFKIGPTILATPVQNDTVLMEATPAENLQDPFMGQISTVSTVQSPSSETSGAADSIQTDITTTSTSLSDVEGSGEDNFQVPVITSRRPIRGGFDILSFFRSAFGFKRYARSSRQFFTTCSDRITMPCIIEDFLGAGMGPLPGCEPVHCGSQFCASGVKPCRIESTVSPFYLGINFGDGIGKGSAEDNIGACIRYTQMPCI